jgi:hypothetical protein
MPVKSLIMWRRNMLRAWIPILQVQRRIVVAASMAGGIGVGAAAAEAFELKPKCKGMIVSSLLGLAMPSQPVAVGQ